jgi:hypothetical protein
MRGLQGVLLKSTFMEEKGRKHDRAKSRVDL